MLAANLEQLTENGDPKDLYTDGEDADISKPKKRAAVSRAARGQQNKDNIGASSRKARGNGGGSKPGTDVEATEPKTAATDQINSNAVSKSDQVTRRSSRKVKPRK
jgi:formamidopyrimidine-DNA glycosylase